MEGVLLVNYRFLYVDDKLVGILGQTEMGKILVNGVNKFQQRLLEAIITPVKYDKADELGNLVISESILVEPEDPLWISAIGFTLPYNWYASEISTISEKAFKEFDLTQHDEKRKELKE